MPGFFLGRIALQNPWWHICDSDDDFGIFGQHCPRESLFYILWNHLILDFIKKSILWSHPIFSFMKLTCLFGTSNHSLECLGRSDLSMSLLKYSRSWIQSYWVVLRRLDLPFQLLRVHLRFSSRNSLDPTHFHLFLFYCLVLLNILQCPNSFSAFFGL